MSSTTTEPQERQAARPEPGAGRAWLAVLGLALLAATINGALAGLRAAGAVDWAVWVHPPTAPWTWIPFIHSPVFSAYMSATGTWAEHLGTTPDQVVVWTQVAVHPLLVVAAYLAASGDGRRRRGLTAALLVTLAPTLLRPFEQYPVAMLLTSGSVAATAIFHRRGGVLAWLGALVFGFAAVFFHLSAWFLLLPWWCLLARTPGRGRGHGAIALICLGVVWCLAQPGVFGEGVMGVLDQPSVQRGVAFSGRGLVNLTLECANPVLYLAVLVGLVTAGRGAGPEEATGRPLAAALLVFVVVTSVLQVNGFAIHSGGEYGWHHYYELTEVAVVVSALTLAGRGALARPWLVRLLLATQVLVLVRVIVWLTSWTADGLL